MRATAWTERGLGKDEAGVVCEAFIIKKSWKGNKIAGVQWHPEELKDYQLLHQLIGKTKRVRGTELAAKAVG